MGFRGSQVRILSSRWGKSLIYKVLEHFPGPVTNDVIGPGVRSGVRSVDVICRPDTAHRVKGHSRDGFCRTPRHRVLLPVSAAGVPRDDCGSDCHGGCPIVATRGHPPHDPTSSVSASQKAK